MRVDRIPKTAHREALAFCRTLNQNAKTGSYPLCTSQAALDAEYGKSMAHPSGFQVRCSRNGKLLGVMYGFAETDSGYMQTTGFYVAEGDMQAADALSAWFDENGRGHTVHIGLPAENTTAAAALHANGYGLLDDALDLRLRAGDFKKAEDGIKIRRITESSLPRYLEFHRRHFNECYWNAQRIGEAFADWRLYAPETEGEITSGLFLREFAGNSAEIYGLYAETEEGAIALLSKAVSDLIADTPQFATVIFMADTVDTAAISAAFSLGFKQQNHYRCYTKSL